MNRMPLASIVISSYNYERFLSEAINSALDQTYPYLEVIVVDDGSKDQSPQIIRGYGDRIISIFKENRGQASAFNTGFQASRGQAVFFLDSDDALLSGAVQKAMGFFLEPDVAKVHWSLYKVNEHGRRAELLELRRPLAEGNVREELIHQGPDGYGWPPTSGNAWARRFLEKVLPIPEEMFVTCPDSYLAALAPLFGSIKRIVEPQGLYRVHGQNSMNKVSLSQQMRMFDYCCTVLKKYLWDMGVDVDPEVWKQRDPRYTWMKRLHMALQSLRESIPPQHTFLLVDDNQLETNELALERRVLPFMEKDGQYWGPPLDDETAIREIERLRQGGASFIAFAWPAFWWLDFYCDFHHHLRSTFHCVSESDDFVVFDLRP